MIDILREYWLIAGIVGGLAGGVVGWGMKAIATGLEIQRLRLEIKALEQQDRLVIPGTAEELERALRREYRLRGLAASTRFISSALALSVVGALLYAGGVAVIDAYRVRRAPVLADTNMYTEMRSREAVAHLARHRDSFVSLAVDLQRLISAADSVGVTVDGQMALLVSIRARVLLLYEAVGRDSQTGGVLWLSSGLEASMIEFLMRREDLEFPSPVDRVWQSTRKSYKDVLLILQQANNYP